MTVETSWDYKKQLAMRKASRCRIVWKLQVKSPASDTDLQLDLRHGYLEVSPIKFKAVYFQVGIHGIAAMQPSPMYGYSEVRSTYFIGAYS